MLNGKNKLTEEIIRIAECLGLSTDEYYKQTIEIAKKDKQPAVDRFIARDIMQKYINDSIPGRYTDYSDLAVKAGVGVKIFNEFMENKTTSMDLMSIWRLISALDLELVPRDKSADKVTEDVEMYKKLASAFEKLALQYEADKSRLTQVNRDLRKKMKGMKPKADKIVADHGEDAEEVIDFMREFDVLYIMGQRGENLAVAPETTMQQ
jgi:hypothetical protein